MKCIKNIITITAFCAIGSINARIESSPTAPGASQSEGIEQTEQSGNTYKNLLDDIRNMNKSAVLSEDNTTLKPEFITLIKDKASNLSETELKALLQAGVNLHADWTGTPAQDQDKLAKFNKQIDTSAKEILPAATTTDTEIEEQKTE